MARHHRARAGGDRRRGEIAVEEVVVVLVGGDPRHHGVADRVADQLAGVAVGDPRGQLLEREVDEPVGRRLGVRGDPARNLGHAPALEVDRIDGPGRHQVAVDRHRVAAFLGSPPAGPRAPRAVGAEHPLDRAEVVRQVVLGEQVDDQRRAHGVVDRRPAEVGVGLRPRLAGDGVASAAVGDQLVREPLLGGCEVAFEQRLDRGLELAHQRGVVHAASIPPLPTE